jgi:hypothetical protein
MLTFGPSPIQVEIPEERRSVVGGQSSTHVEEVFGDLIELQESADSRPEDSISQVGQTVITAAAPSDAGAGVGEIHSPEDSSTVVSSWIVQDSVTSQK